jgi:hypothetical protein
MLAHIEGGKVIGEYNEGKGRVTFKSGITVSPPTAGVYGDEQYGFEQLVPIVVVTVDNSTTTRTTSASVDTVEADRVLRTVTISDVGIEERRAGMWCEAVDGQLTLGEENWAKVIEYRDQEYIAAADGYPAQEATTWRERTIINGSTRWKRGSQQIKFIGHLLGFNDEQMDAMFDAAALIRA